MLLQQSPPIVGRRAAVFGRADEHRAARARDGDIQTVQRFARLQLLLLQHELVDIVRRFSRRGAENKSRGVLRFGGPVGVNAIALIALGAGLAIEQDHMLGL